MIFQKVAAVIEAALLLSLGSIAAQAQACSSGVLSGDRSYRVVGQDGTAAPFKP